MGIAYCDLLTDREMLRFQLQAYAACDDPDIQRVVRDEWTNSVRLSRPSFGSGR